jgi:hypothetical protein
MHDVDFCAAKGVVVERIETNAHDHFFNLFTVDLSVTIVDSVISEFLNMVVGKIG